MTASTPIRRSPSQADRDSTASASDHHNASIEQAGDRFIFQDFSGRGEGTTRRKRPFSISRISSAASPR